MTNGSSQMRDGKCMRKEMRDETDRERCEQNQKRSVVCVLCAVCVGVVWYVGMCRCVVVICGGCCGVVVSVAGCVLLLHVCCCMVDCRLSAKKN